MIVDDHPAILDALVAVFDNAEGLEVCGVAGTADDAFAVAECERPDVAVIDIALPDAHGLDLVQNLLSQYPTLGIAVFSVYDEMVYAERSIRAGALAYVMKQESTQAVLEAIRCVARGEVYLSRVMASRIVTKSASRHRATSPSPTDLLTDREVAVLQLLGGGCSVEEVSTRLHISRKTVETHRRHAKEKLGFDTVSELLVFAVRWSDGQTRLQARTEGSAGGRAPAIRRASGDGQANGLPSTPVDA